MHKILIIIALIAAVAGLLLFLVSVFTKVDVRPYEKLRNPAIRTIPDMRVIQVSFEVPGSGLGRVFGVLFKTYFSTKGTPKGKAMQPPATRYINTIDFDMMADERQKAVNTVIWKGMSAMQVTDAVTQLNIPKDTGGLQVELTTWKYGETAEILHVGPYEKEAPTVKRLLDFIDESGYEINGLHEELYVIGPGNPLVSPEKYYTIIRYPVKPKK